MSSIRSAEVQKSARQFSDGLEFSGYFLSDLTCGYVELSAAVPDVPNHSLAHFLCHNIWLAQYFRRTLTISHKVITWP